MCASAQGASYAANPAVVSVCANQALKILMTTGGGKGRAKGRAARGTQASPKPSPHPLTLTLTLTLTVPLTLTPATLSPNLSINPTHL